MADILNIISIISYVLAAVALVLAIVCWIVFKIPSVIGDLSGRNARKSIELMRQNNEKAGKQVAKKKDNPVKVTKTSNAPVKQERKQAFDETGLLGENAMGSRDEQETGMLVEDTALLQEDFGATALLVPETENVMRKPSNIVINMIEDIMIIHTEEVIE